MPTTAPTSSTSARSSVPDRRVGACGGCFPTPARRRSPSSSTPLDLPTTAHRSAPTRSRTSPLTLDGRATIAGRSGPIGTDTDTEMLVGLRTRVDAVMIGAGTMRAERYGRLVPTPSARPTRGARARPRSARGPRQRALDLPWERRLFTERAGAGPDRHHRDEDEPPETATPSRSCATRTPSTSPSCDATPARASTTSAVAALRGRAAPARAADRGRPGRRALRHPRAEARRAATGRGWSRACRSASGRSSWSGCCRRTTGELFARYRMARRRAARPSRHGSGRRGSAPCSSDVRSPRRRIRSARIVAAEDGGERRG